MTLSTHVYLLTQADPRDVFFKCRDLLGAGESHPWREGDWYDGARYLTNEIGLGLPALMSVHYRNGGMLQPQAEGCDKWCGEDCTFPHDPPHWAYIDFDTAYGYRDENGRGCGALHASLLAQLGQWLDEQGIRWAWRNEFTSEIHVGDKYEHLYDLWDGGEDARRWWSDVVKPAIERHIGRVLP